MSIYHLLLACRLTLTKTQMDKKTNPVIIAMLSLPLHIEYSARLTWLLNLGGEANVCNPSGRRKLWKWGSRFGPAEACRGFARSKHGVVVGAFLESSGLSDVGVGGTTSGG